jgi:hypothetical protein
MESLSDENEAFTHNKFNEAPGWWRNQYAAARSSI